MKIFFETMDIRTYMDSHYNFHPMMNIEAEINGREAMLYIGEGIRITDGYVSVAYKGVNYQTVYGEKLAKELEQEILNTVMYQYNLTTIEDIITLIEEQYSYEELVKNFA